MTHPIHEANAKSPFGNLTKKEFYKHHSITHQESFIINSENMKIFTQSWCPTTHSKLRGLVAMIHGYSSQSCSLFQLTAVAIAKLGFVTVALDLRGHGRSEGPTTHLPSIHPVISDCVQVFDSARSKYPTLPAFLYGESLGGAIAILVALQQKEAWSGLILNGAMCGVSDKIKPIWPLEKFLPLMVCLVPRWRAILSKSLIEKSFKVKWKRELVRKDHKQEHATYATAMMMEKVVEEIERRCVELSLPLLMVHGSNDEVCDLKSAEFVFEKAGSKDKSLKVINGAWHMLVAEEEEVVNVGFGYVFDWLMEKAMKFSSC